METLLATKQKDFINCFMELSVELDDIREDSKLLYPMDEILFLTIAAVLSCAESWKQIYEYGIDNLDFLSKYFPYKHGIPSKSTICFVLGVINKHKFEAWFLNWASNLIDIMPEDLINIDGKTVRGSKTKHEKAAHILNVFAKKQGLILAQKTVGEKTNEIPEIPKLLDNLNISGATITIDAMGCQKEIVAKIIEKDANYFIGLKANQPLLYDAARYLFEDKNNASEYFDYFSERNKAHGRIEWRKCWVTAIPEWFANEYPDWAGLKSICLIESERHMNKKRSIEQRLYISSEILDAKKGLINSRGHWSIENQVHYVLDVTFKEDNCRVHNAAENMSIIRKIIFNLIKKYKLDTNNKSSIPTIRKKAGWLNSTAAAVLGYLSA